MEVALAAIADSANVSREGKLNLSGIYDTIWARSFPVQHPTMVLAFRLRLQEDDSGQEKEVQVTLVDQAGSPIWGGSLKLEAGPIPKGEVRHDDHIIELRGVEFKVPGQYSFEIRPGGDRRSTSVPVRVVEIP